MATATKAKETEAEAPVTIPSNISWQQTTIVHKGGFQGAPVEQWALDSVQASYDAFTANEAAPALEATFESERQAKAVLHQLRRAAKQLGFGLAARIDGSKLAFQAKNKKMVPAKA